MFTEENIKLDESRSTNRYKVYNIIKDNKIMYIFKILYMKEYLKVRYPMMKFHPIHTKTPVPFIQYKDGYLNVTYQQNEVSSELEENEMKQYTEDIQFTKEMVQYIIENILNDSF